MPYKDPNRQRDYQARWIKKRRHDWVRKNGPCEVCNSDEGLQVDHIDPNEKVSHRIWSWSEARRAVELAKCWVLCFNCHNAKTKGMNGW